MPAVEGEFGEGAAFNVCMKNNYVNGASGGNRAVTSWTRTE